MKNITKKTVLILSIFILLNIVLFSSCQAGYKECSACDGTGKCNRCYGTGLGLSGDLKCSNCGGTGDCPVCGGTGQINTGIADTGVPGFGIPLLIISLAGIIILKKKSNK